MRALTSPAMSINHLFILLSVKYYYIHLAVLCSDEVDFVIGTLCNG